MDSRAIQADVKKLARLLDPTGDTVTLYQGADLRVILRHQFEAPLAEELSLPICGAEDRAVPLLDLDPSLKTFSDLFHHERPPIDLLRRAKDFAKSCRAYPELLPPEVATVLYYAAITAALVRHGERITELDDAGWKTGLQWGIAQPWVHEKTQELFRRGLACLK